MLSTGYRSFSWKAALILAASFLFTAQLWAEDDPNEVVKAELGKLSFFLGQWITTSVTVPGGLEVSGDLSYESVLGGTYLLLRFVGDHPERPVYESYKMITWDASLGAYVAYTFARPGKPARTPARPRPARSCGARRVRRRAPARSAACSTCTSP